MTLKEMRDEKTKSHIERADLEAYLTSLRHGQGPKESVPPAPKKKPIFQHIK
jgi:hypothetical protein